MSDHISDLLLERLALGELDDDTAAELLARLEAKGELHRFEALIADNEEFERRFSAPVIASQIAERARRQTRVVQPKPRRNSPKIVLAVVALTVVVAGIWAISNQPAVPEKPEVAGPSRPDVPLPGPAPDEKPPEAKSEKFEVSIIDPAGEFPFPQNLYMRVGEKITFRAPTAKRVELSLSKLAKVSREENNDLTVEAVEAGRTTLRVLQREKPGERSAIASTFLSISDPFDYEKLTELANSEPKITSCSAQAPGFRGVLRIGVVVQVKANVASMEFLGATADDVPQEQLQALRSCVEEIVAYWDVEHNDWSSDTLRVNFASGEVCPQDKDC